jgi:hypothetical protein
MTNTKPYLGNDQLHVGNGKGLVISNTAHTTLHILKRTFILSNVLHMPQIKKKNNSYLFNSFIVKIVFFEFHSSVFYVKDLIITKKVLLSGQGEDGIYILSESSTIFMPQAF